MYPLAKIGNASIYRTHREEMLRESKKRGNLFQYVDDWGGGADFNDREQRVVFFNYASSLCHRLINRLH